MRESLLGLDALLDEGLERATGREQVRFEFATNTRLVLEVEGAICDGCGGPSRVSVEEGYGTDAVPIRTDCRTCGAAVGGEDVAFPTIGDTIVQGFGDSVDS